MDRRSLRHAANAVQTAIDCATKAHRRYKREYMRRWRSDPRNLERELHTRLRAELTRRVRPAGLRVLLAAGADKDAGEAAGF
jgi:hypothetical protein